MVHCGGARSGEEHPHLGTAGPHRPVADKPIHLHGSDVTLSNWADLIEREAFHGGQKWNPALVEAPVPTSR